jgi:hypothetical protein
VNLDWSRTTVRAAVVASLCLLTFVLAAPALRAQKIAWPPKNLQVLDKSITQEQLKATMEGFTEQLGVKCTHCHILDQYEKDELEHKREARKMILLTQHMRANKAKYFKEGVKEELISCGTCHRGHGEPEEFVP